MSVFGGGAERLLSALRRAARAAAEQERLEPAPAGVTPATRAVLDPLVSALALPAGELARLAELTPSALSHTLRRLERERLIERERQRGDARVVLVRLTREGRRALQPARVAQARLLDTLDDALPAAELYRLAESLEQLAYALEQPPRPLPPLPA